MEIKWKYLGHEKSLNVQVKSVLWEYSYVEEYFIIFYIGKFSKYSFILLAVLPRNKLDPIIFYDLENINSRTASFGRHVRLKWGCPVYNVIPLQQQTTTNDVNKSSADRIHCKTCKSKLFEIT